MIADYIEQTPFFDLQGSFHNPIKALHQAVQESADLIFLDINMPDLNGIELARLLPPNTRVIFTTAYQEYALESYQVAALDYLVKPISYEEFLQAAQKARAYFDLVYQPSNSGLSRDYLFVKADYKLHKINHQDIRYIQNVKDYVQIYLENGTRIMALMSLRSLVEKLPSDQFMQVHRSYLVNLNKITIIERNRIVFGEVYIPISDRYKVHFQTFLEGK